jgi:hypothetical protein
MEGPVAKPVAHPWFPVSEKGKQPFLLNNVTKT